MSTKNKDFILSGPSQLTVVDWGNSDHRRIVMASLVRGVYVLQSDLKNGRQGTQALASQWWESFHFTLKKELKKGNSIYGAIYQLMDPSPIAFQSPQFVIAFRGTRMKEDLILDWNILINKLSTKARFKEVLEYVKHLITSYGGANVWLAGHSLGAAIALLVGKDLAKNNCMLQTYLFNPPIVSIPTNLFTKNEKLKKVINGAKIAGGVGVTFTKEAVSALIGPSFDRVDPFNAIREWVPHLCLNPADPISSEFIEYFKTREFMRKRGLGKVERYANKVSLFPLTKRAEPMHLLASAELNINEDRSKRHSLRQWYDVDLHFKTKVHRHTCSPSSGTGSGSD